MSMQGAIRQATLDHTVMLLRREITVIRQALERGDKAKANSAIMSATHMLGQLDDMAQKLSPPPNE